MLSNAHIYRAFIQNGDVEIFCNSGDIDPRRARQTMIAIDTAALEALVHPADGVGII